MAWSRAKYFLCTVDGFEHLAVRHRTGLRVKHLGKSTNFLILDLTASGGGAVNVVTLLGSYLKQCILGYAGPNLKSSGQITRLQSLSEGNRHKRYLKGVRRRGWDECR